jgi:hypothetical protein
MWGCSSVGRAVALQAIGQEFESPQLHQLRIFDLRFLILDFAAAVYALKSKIEIQKSKIGTGV